MHGFFNRLNRFLVQPLGLSPRLMVAAAALLLCAIYLFPLWNLTMFAPQYPEGIRLDIYSYKLEGGNGGQDIKEINVLTSTDDGTFANMAGTAAEAMTPGIIGMGTSKLASATGSIVDGRVEAVKMIRVRVKLKDTNELVEVQQEVTPNFTLKIGQEVVITQGSTPGNVWPD